MENNFKYKKFPPPLSFQTKFQSYQFSCIRLTPNYNIVNICLFFICISASFSVFKSWITMVDPFIYMQLQIYHSYFLVVIAHNVFILGFIYANEKGLHPIQTNLLRGLATFFINFLLIRHFKLGMEFKLSSNHKYLLIRSGSICIHSLTLALCGFYLPQPVIHTINCTGPIFVIIEDYFINRVKINSQQLKGIIFTFVGIILTINGEGIVKHWFDEIPKLNSETTFQNYASESPLEKILMGTLFAFMASIWAYGTIVVKNIVELNSLHINLHFGIFTTIVNGLLYPIFVTNPHPPQVMAYGLFLCGAPMAMGNIMYIYALMINKNTGLVTICISSAVVVGYVISVFRYNEAINLICLTGSILIVVGLIVALTAKKGNELDQKLLKDKITMQGSEKMEEIQLEEKNNPKMAQKRSSNS